MKNLLIVILILSLATLSSIVNKDGIHYNQSFADHQNYSNGVLNTEVENINSIANYNMHVEYLSQNKSITVNESIVWINRTEYTTDEIYFHLYANGYDHFDTEFLHGRKLPGKFLTRFNIDKFSVNGQDKNLDVIYPRNNINDKTVARVLLDKRALQGDSVKINFQYDLKIPLSYRRMGYAEGRDFSFIAQWFPKVGVFENGKWICDPYYKTTEFYSDFGEYKVEIKVPENFVVGATGVQTSKIDSNNFTTYKFAQTGVHDFAFFVSDEIFDFQKIYNRKDDSKILIELFVQPENKKYIQRYFNAVENSLEFMEENIASYPYQTVTIVDVPRTSNVAGREHPTIFTVSADLLSPVDIHEPEEVTIHEFVHQYFYGVVANNEVTEAWIDEGITSYLTTKILDKYYGKELHNFKFLKEVPVYGLNFLNFYEIPIIYILGFYELPEGDESFYYYSYLNNIGAIADSSFKHASFESYFNNTYAKPGLMFLSLEKILGEEKLLAAFRKFYQQNKFKHAKGEDLIMLVKDENNENLDWFFENIFYSTKTFDYKISSVQKIDEINYKVVVERLGDGVFQNEIYFYTESDTLVQYWDGKDKWKEFVFQTNDKILGAEIDPQRKNMFDINFTNNSYTVEPRYWASLSITMRWFFWVQNALMVLGSIG